MQANEKMEFAHDGQTGYLVITRDVRPQMGDVIGLIKVEGPPGMLKRIEAGERVAERQVLWQRLWRPTAIQEAARNILKVASDKDNSESYPTDFSGPGQVTGKLVVRRNEKAITLIEEFGGGTVGCEVALPVKLAKKLANTILAIEVAVPVLEPESA